MRRSGRQLGEVEAREILARGAYGVLSTVGPDVAPYGVPLSYCVLGAARVFRIDVASLSGRARRA